MQNFITPSQTNPPNQFSKQCLAQALIRLLDHKELGQINVTDICRQAGFSRMAYYRNFSSKEDILRQYMMMLADEFRAEAMQKYPDHSTRSLEIILFAFSYFQRYRVFAERLIQANLSSILQDGLNYYFEKHVASPDASPERRYAMYYYSGALYNMYTCWVKNGLRESPEWMARIVYRILNHE